MMPEPVRLDEPFSIIADTERAAAPLCVLKEGDTFGVFDQHGDLVPSEGGEQGLYHDGTRFLSRLELLIGRGRPLLLSSTTSEDNVLFTADLTNPDVFRDGARVLARGELHVFRARVLQHGGAVERVRVTNHALHPVDVPITFRFDADFADVFEVRGTRRIARGDRLPDASAPQAVLRYRGLDGIERRTRLLWNRAPDRVDGHDVTFVLHLDQHARAVVELAIVMESGAESRPHSVYEEVLRASRTRSKAETERGSQVRASNQVFNRWLKRSVADLRMMITDTPHGVYPYAGIPWFSTPFGRDGIITALEVLWADPEVARGVLAFLADTQATSYADAQDAQPGKILHEMRSGEMAALAEVPFGRYYGTADATPLFVMLAHAYFERTGDLPFIDRLWPHLLAALDWMQTDGDPDRDGFIEYARRTATGLAQQGWKDSNDSIFHADGALAEPPIALCEIQGYAYAAWHGASQMAAIRGDHGLAAQWRDRAERLRARFDEAFWCEEIGTYALALDGRKQPCRVRTSNPGHCLLTGIVLPERADRLASTLMSEESFAGWGIRTVASGEARYNPMSYHNGSIWPHDTALVAAGLARYGYTEAAARVLSAMFDLSQAVDLHRLPELICGFDRGDSESPTLYPVACAPQAWAAGAVFLLIQACLGLRVEAVPRRVSFVRALLPPEIDWLRISRLAVGDGFVDLQLERHPQDVGVTVLQRQGRVEIIGVK
jgi:glycogen debranching enzyme